MGNLMDFQSVGMMVDDLVESMEYKMADWMENHEAVH